MSVLAVGTTLLVDAHWGPAPLVALLIAAAVVAAGGISLLVATFARTAQQAGGLNAVVAMSLAALGGVFIPLSQAPAALATISQVTPHAWFLRGSTPWRTRQRASTTSCRRSSCWPRWA